MHHPLLYKKRYIQSNCVPIYNRHQYAKKVEIERKLLGKKDGIIEQVTAANGVAQSM